MIPEQCRPELFFVAVTESDSFSYSARPRIISKISGVSDSTAGTMRIVCHIRSSLRRSNPVLESALLLATGLAGAPGSTAGIRSRHVVYSRRLLVKFLWFQPGAFFYRRAVQNIRHNSATRAHSILIMIRRRNAFTVFGLMFILSATSLLVRPIGIPRSASSSRSVR